MADNILPALATLNDLEIIELCSNGILIRENYTAENVQQACYELRASNIYYDLSDGKRKFTLKPDEYILLKPKQAVVIITFEELNLPPNILGRILTKGKLFSLGLLPVNTYADPGFDGKLGIVLYNLSNDFIKIAQQQEIAKIEFSRLANSVIRPYKGQHGYQTEIWPIPEDMLLTPEEIRNDPRIRSSSEEIVRSYGSQIGQVIDRVYRFERKLIFAAICYIFLSVVLIFIMDGNPDWLTPFVGLVLGVISNVVFSILAYFATNIRK
jgi:dCTP deaminase